MPEIDKSKSPLQALGQRDVSAAAEQLPASAIGSIVHLPQIKPEQLGLQSINQDPKQGMGVQASIAGNQSQALSDSAASTIDPHKFMEKLSQSEAVSMAPRIASYFLLAGNAVAVLSHLLRVPENMKNMMDKAADFGTKLFLHVNGTVNAIEQFKEKNYLSAIGYFNENLVAFLFDRFNTFLGRGIAVGLYTAANALTLTNKSGKFNSLGEHIDHLWAGLKRNLGYIFNDGFRGFLKNFRSAHTGLASFISGCMMTVAPFVWKLFNNKGVAVVLRTLGGFMQDYDQIKPENNKPIEKGGRPNYFKSGLWVTAGTAFELLAKAYPQYQNIFVPLSLATDRYGGLILRDAQLSGEMLGRADALEDEVEAIKSKDLLSTVEEAIESKDLFPGEEKEQPAGNLVKLHPNKTIEAQNLLETKLVAA